MTRRLVLWLTGTTVLFWLAAAGLGAYVMREEFDEAFDASLQETAERLLPLVVDGLFQRDPSAGPRRVSGSSDGGEYLTYQLRSATGAVLLNSHDAQLEPFDAPLKEGFADTPQQRVYTAAAVSGTLFLQVADNLEERREATTEGMLSLLLPILPLVPLSMATVWFIVRRSLRPISALRQEIGGRHGGNLAPLEVAGLPTELEPISVSVNRLLDRLRTALEAEREFAANSAHELRTPIAGALAQTQRLVAELQPGPQKSRAQNIVNSLAALGHVAEKLLQLSRADAGIGASLTSVDIVTIVELVAEDISRMADHTGRLVIDHSGIPDEMPLTRRLDADALAIIVRNLIENALLHGAKDQPVKIRITSAGTLAVTNNGPVVAKEHLGGLTQRFKRADSAASGAGLGLAIVERLARQMEAKLTLRSPAPGQKDGFSAELSFGNDADFPARSSAL